MVRTFLTFLLLVWIGIVSIAADPIETSPGTPPPPFRYLFVLDTSSAMSREKEAAVDVIYKLLLSGIGGRVQPGDALGIWTFSDELRTSGYPTEIWIPENREVAANRAFRWLRDLKFSKKADLSIVTSAIRDAAVASGSLTVFLLTDGSKPLEGTRFDSAVNTIFQDHSEEMRKARKPFILVFVAVDGKLVAHSVNRPEGRIYVPNVATTTTRKELEAQAKKPAAQQDTKPPVEPPRVAAATPPADPPRTAPQTSLANAQPEAATPPNKNLSVDEIAALLKKSDAERAKKAAAESAAAATVATARPEPAAPQDAAPREDTSPAQPSPVPAPTEQTAVKPEPQSPIVDSAAGPSPVSNRQPPAAVAALPPEAKSGSVTSDSSAPPTRPPAESAAPIPAPQTLDPAHPTSASPPDRTLAINNPAGLSADAKLYLALAILFLFVACVFGYFLFRRPRTTFGPSLISRMMDEEKDKK